MNIEATIQGLEYQLCDDGCTVPACTESSGAVVSKEVFGAGGFSVTFECDQCDEQWNVVF